MKMKAKLSILFTGIFLIMFTLSAMVGYLGTKESIEENVTSYLQAEADNISLYIDAWLDKRLKTVATVASVVEDTYILQHIITDPTQHAFLKPTEFDDGSIDYYMGLEDKTFISGTGWKPPADYDATQRPWYKLVKEKNKPVFTEAYVDMNSGKVSVSAVAPISNASGAFKGAVSTDIYLDILTELILSRTFEDRGYAFLLAEDGTLLAHPNEEMLNTNLKDNADYSEIFQAIQNEREGFEEYTEDNTQKIMIHKKIPSTNWTFAIVLDKTLAYKPLRDLTNKYMIIMLIGTALIILISLAISQKVVKPIRNLSVIIERLSHYDLSFDQNSEAVKYLNKKDEIGTITRALATMQENLIVLVKDISSSSQQVASSSEELTATSQQSAIAADEVAKTIEEIAKGASDQAKNTENGAVNINELGELIQKEQLYIKDLNISTKEVDILKDEGVLILKDLIKKSEKSAIVANDVNKVIINTNESAEKIENASKMIKSIAEQTNLLALNAAIEAARAGEAGRGFSIVADEIRKLAEQSNKFTEEIASIIGELIDKTGNAVEKMKEAGEIVASQMESVEMTNEKFERISAAIEKMKDVIESINRSGQGMEDKKREIIGIIESLSAISQENAAGTEEAAASVEEQTASMEEIANASESLSKLAEEMHESISKFKF